MARWWPMEKLERSGRLAAHAGRAGRPARVRARRHVHRRRIGRQHDSGMGVPTLDGLGPIGGNDHAPAEYLEVASIVPRTTLVAGLLLAIARDPLVLSWRGGA